jgi:adenosylhomocysteine nucleosidase
MMFDAVMEHGVLFVMATTHEYGPALQKRIAPLITGVGPVEAAIGLTKALATLEAKSSLPRLVVALGSAGSARLEHASLYQARSVSYRDIDASPLGFEKGCTPFLDLPAAISIPIRLPGMPEASLSTGGNIVTGAVYDGIDADMVDMETFALLRVCQSYDVPLLAIRGISDGRSEVSKLSDWTDYLHIIDERLALAVDDVLRALNDGALGI